jgi:hypothetical protein
VFAKDVDSIPPPPENMKPIELFFDAAGERLVSGPPVKAENSPGTAAKPNSGAYMD